MDNSIPWFETTNSEVYLNSTQIFKCLDIRLLLNENTVILGPNGSGKSTLLKIIDRTIYPVVKKGSNIKFFNKKSISLWELRARVGFLSTEQEKRIDRNSKTWQVIYSGLSGRYRIDECKVNLISQKELLDLIITELSLDSIAGDYFVKLSDGQKRIALIARALIHKPDILVLDEPLCRLDLKAKSNVLKLIKKIIDNGTTVLQVTHDLQSITSEINRVILMKNRKIVGDGKTADCLTSEKISNLFDLPLLITKSRMSWQAYPK